MNKLDEYYTVREFAEKMRVTERTVYRWIKLEVVHAIQRVRGGEYRIPQEEVDKMSK